MDNPWLIYEWFNRVEGIAWFAIAVALPFVIKTVSGRQKITVLAASLAFVLFGISDFLEAPTHGRLPLWLWAYKIGCAVFILGCRYNFVGWNKMCWNDRYSIFGMSCFAASLGAIVLQHLLGEP